MSEQVINKVKPEEIDIESKFNDMNGINDSTFKNMQLMRGKTPEDIEEKCLNLCKDYLSGNWCQQTVDTIEVRRITGGLMNQLYYCGIRKLNDNYVVPQEVAIRLYDDNIDDTDKGRIRDLVVSLIFSENNLGPKIYGIFEGGQILQFYKHRQFEGDDQKNPELVQKVFRTLAQIHSMDLPLKKKEHFFFQMVDKIYVKVIERFPINQLIEEYNCETLKTYDLKTEIDWIKGVIERVNSPVTFTHNDYRSGNLLITDPSDELVVCDFDLAGYLYRGNDFVAIMKEWGREQFEFKSIDKLPLDSQFKQYIQIYVEECERIYGKSYSENPINSVEHILKEAKIFLLFSYLFYAIVPMRHYLNRDRPNYKYMMEYAELNYKHYMVIKNILKDQKMID